MFLSHGSFALGSTLALALLFSSSTACAEDRPPERGVPLMATGAALYATSYGISLAIGITATADYVARCGHDGPRPWGEALACLDAPSAMHLMIPVAGPFRALAETRNADAADRALLVADGIAQITGVVLAGIGMAQYIDGKARRPERAAEKAESAVRVAPLRTNGGAGLVVLGTF
jgi:hypothetical protein